MLKFDLIVIGGGPGGYLAAERAAEGGLKVAVFEKRALGGVCLNEGCIPSKALLNSAKMFEHAKHSEAFGVYADNVRIDHKQVVQRKNKVVKQLVSGIGMKMKALKVTVVTAEAAIKGKTTDGFEIVADNESYFCDKLIIATGSEALVPGIPGLKENYQSGFVMTNREILDLETLPETLTVIGGGVIGLEMASYFSTIGVKVTVIEMLDKIAGPTEKEISDILLKEYVKMGIDFKLSCKVTEVKNGEVFFEEKGEIKSVKADKVLVSIGRRANTQGIGLENINVYTERGAIVTDDMMKTNIPNVYAVGDVNGKSMLAHTAYREAEVAVNNILGKKDIMRYNAIPAVIYTNPEVATVGETEESAKAKGIEVKVAKLTMNYSGRYMAEVEGGKGIVKLIADKKNDRLIGVHLIGSYTSEMIYGAAMMLETEMKIDELKKIVFPHPTVCEVIREALFEL